MTAPGADQAQMTALFRRLFHGPGFIIPFEVMPLGFAIGMATLSVGLRKARIASRWSAICIGAGAIGLCLIGFVPASAYAVAVSIVFSCGLVPLGLASLGIQASHERTGAPTPQSDVITGSR